MDWAHLDQDPVSCLTLVSRLKSTVPWAGTTWQSTALANREACGFYQQDHNYDAGLWQGQLLVYPPEIRHAHSFPFSSTMGPLLDVYVSFISFIRSEENHFVMAQVCEARLTLLRVPQEHDFQSAAFGAK